MTSLGIPGLVCEGPKEGTREVTRIYAAPEELTPGQEFVEAQIDWFGHHEHEMELTGGGGGHGNHWIIRGMEGLGPLRKALVENLDAALAHTNTPDFDLDVIDIRACLYHHQCEFSWHTDEFGYPGTTPMPSRALTFVYYMNTLPKMWNGGELEFENGLTLEPQSNQLILFNPAVRHRVNPVKCWSRDCRHGRWTLTGWFHKKLPESGHKH